ncbi:MAG: YfiR family protein [Gammaproteobacteria bacterium]|nr:YfiR family protein [Gammaproteobacteria bacterium]
MKKYSLLLFLTCLLFSSNTLTEEIDSEEERLFKAAFTYNFAKFTIWPENTPGNTGPLILCTIGESKLVTDLKRLEGKNIKGRAVTIKGVTHDKAKDHCHILYIAKSEKNKVSTILKSVNSKPILSVSETSDFIEKGGIIQFYRKNGKTNLIINLNTAHKSGLEISSRLLILAKVINNEEMP